MVNSTLSVLLVEDNLDDAELLFRHLRRNGFELSARRVASQAEFEAALAEDTFDIVLSDFALPSFSGRRALDVLKASGLDLPFVVVSGAIGERQAVDMMRAGASDYLSKDDLARLVPVIQRELREAVERRERRRAQEALRRSEAERRREAMLLNQTQVIAGVGGWEFDVATGALYWTEQVYKLFGVDPAKFRPTTESFMRLVVAEDRPRVAERWGRILSAEMALDVEYRVSTGSGQIRWFRTLGRSSMEHGRVARITGANLDIEDRKQVEAKLLLADRLSSMGAVTASVVHEINNPLAFIVGNLPAVRERLERGAREELEAMGAPGRVAALVADLDGLVGDCMDGAERIAEITRDLKVYSRVEERVGGVSQLREVLASVVRMVGAEARLRATLSVEVGELPLVVGASSRLAQLFTNLLINALQALPVRPLAENFVFVRARRVETNGGAVLVEVEDNGRGISAEVLPRLFEPFFTTKPPGEGTGLGLYVCRNIVDVLGGRIDVDSELGRGATFKITLPIAPAEASAEQSASSDLLSAGARRARILIVDDEPNLLRVVQRTLSKHEVVTLVSGREAEALWRTGERFDLILCDLMLRGLSGAELYAVIGATEPAAQRKMLFMSGGAFTEAAAQFVKALPKEQLIEKPFTPARLQQAVDRLLARDALALSTPRKAER